MTIFTIRPLLGMGNDGTPQPHFHLNRDIIVHALCDSLPETKKSAGPESKQTTEESGNTVQVIKEVPKSRKQVKPIALPAATQIKPINPIKIVKPKIIKPVIRIH